MPTSLTHHTPCTRRSLLPVLAVACASLATSPASAADYSQAGPLQVQTDSFNAGAASGKVAYPTTGSGPFPTLVLGHGALFANADQQIGWGQHFASYGFVAVAVQLGSFPDGNGGAPIINAALTYLDGAGGALAGLADTNNLGLEGFSAGGQAFAVAAATLKPQALVLFDPVAGGQGGGTEPGGSAVPNICSPTLTILTTPSTCNSQGNWAPFAMASSGPRASLRVVGATHCDGEKADRGALCGGFCGGAATPGKQASFAHYGTAWFLAHLKGDAEARAEVTAMALSGDSAIVSGGAADGPDCGGGNGGSGGAGNGGSAGAAVGGAGSGGEAGSGTAGQPGFGGSAGSAGSAQGGSTQGGAGGQGGSAQGGSTQGGAGAAAGSAQGGSAGSTQGGSSSDDSGCSCRTATLGGATAPGSSAPGVAALGLLLGLAWRKRRPRA